MYIYRSFTVPLFSDRHIPLTWDQNFDICSRIWRHFSLFPPFIVPHICISPLLFTPSRTLYILSFDEELQSHDGTLLHNLSFLLLVLGSDSLGIKIRYPIIFSSLYRNFYISRTGFAAVNIQFGNPCNRQVKQKKYAINVRFDMSFMLY